jgi:hypothetical protein
MFIATFAKKNCVAPEERNVLVGCHTFRSPGARTNPFDPVFYKYFVPLGRGSGSEVIDSAIHAILVNCRSSLFLTIYDLLFTIHGS